MHADQLEVRPEVIAALVADQFPQWRDQPIRPATTAGTVNARFRVGNTVVLRFPLLPATTAELEAEQEYARMIAAAVPFAVPGPLGLGEPGPGYPGSWAAYRWIAGEVATEETFGKREAGPIRPGVAEDRHRRTGVAGPGRGGPLATQDRWVRHALSLSNRLIDTIQLSTIWETSLAAPTRCARPASWSG
jgi:aminoglycoside phosphotransferase (APT) family kinase protein